MVAPYYTKAVSEIFRVLSAKGANPYGNWFENLLK
jgi:hypothetical protein